LKKNRIQIAKALSGHEALSSEGLICGFLRKPITHEEILKVIETVGFS